MPSNMNDPIQKEIVAARISLLFTHPFIGQVATRLQLVDATNWLPTAATDGRRLYYNREFIKGLTKNELVFLVGHEILHCVYDHMGRRGNRDPQIWNMAIDYIVNWTLKNNDIGEQPKNTLYSEKYNDEWSSDAVYNDLIKNSVQIEMPFDHHLDFSGKDDDDDKKKGGGSGDKNEDGEDGDNDGDGGGSGDKDGKMRVTVVNDGTDGPVKVTEEDLQKIRNEIKSAVINAAQSVGAGKVPAGVRRMIEELTEPKMDWRELLQMHIKSSIVDDFTYQRVNRRSWNMDFILPGMNVMDTIDVCIAVDVSGSIGDDQIRDFLSEIKGIMETFMDFKIRIWSFDTDVYSYREFGPETMEELLSWEPKGGGGTDFMVNWDYMKKNDIEPERFVMFTDGYPYDSWGDPEYCETLFIIHGNPDGEAPFGMTAHYEDPDNRT